MAKTKLSTVAFTHQAIATLVTDDVNPKTNKPYKGIHSVYSGFMSAYRDYFSVDKVTYIKAIDAMAANGDIWTHPAKGGPMIYLPTDKPTATDNSGRAALAKMGL